MKPISTKVLAFLCLVSAGLVALPTFGRPVPQNLGNGLDKLVESNLILKGQIQALAPVRSGARTGKRTAAKTARVSSTGAYSGFATKQAARFAGMAFFESPTGRYMVDILPNGRVPLAALQSSLTAKFRLLQIKAVDKKYRGVGVIEAWASVDDIPALAQSAGVSAVHLALRPILSVGAVTEHGVHQHRVNQISQLYNSGALTNYDGTGIQIGVMSDSYDGNASATTHAAQDVASGDLPGVGNPVNSQPVVVLEDFVDPGSTDEGRGMCHIIHDVAPKSRIGFATAFNGEVGFANNIRALAGLPGFTKDPSVQQGFVGDIVCDDVSYLNEPMFSDGIIAQAVNDVVAAGKTYASSAANNWGTDGYLSVHRPVSNGTGNTAPGNSALVGTNINLAGVDPALYAGGFHNFNPNGQDVAQLVNSDGDASFVFQWNDPYDVAAPTIIEPPIYEADGTGAGAQPEGTTFTPPPFTAGQRYVIRVNQTSGNYDAIVELKDPMGNVVFDQDTGVDEEAAFFAPVSGQYTIRVHPFETTAGAYHLKVNTATGIARITSDFNILFFDTGGNFLEALSDNNIANNRPIELASLSLGQAQVQMVISRSNTPTPPEAEYQLKYIFFGNGLSGLGPAEYNNYLTPVTFGHSAAAGANSCAAYAVFRPNIPEDFTSPGPITIYFDENANRLTTPEIRLKPDIAAGDGANNTFFPIAPVPGVTDSQFDPDSYPNFYGTSAASPHVAALAALVLQAHGGSGSLTPAQVKTIFQLTAFPHDLDPYFASGTATTPNGGNISIQISSDNNRNAGTGSNDPNSWTVTYTGPGRLDTLKFNPEGTAATGGNTTGGNNNSNPSGNMPEDFLSPGQYSYTPGMVFTSAWLFGNSEGLGAGDVTHTRSNPAPFPSNPSPGNTTQHMWTLNLGFPNNNFTNGDVLRFNVGRSPQQDATVPQGQTVTVFVRDGDYSADMLGGGVLLPEDPNGTGASVTSGMTFSGTVVDGATTYPFNGRLTNAIGKGYSTLDGFGFINIEAAVNATLPPLGVVSRKVHGTAGTFDINLPLAGTIGVECRGTSNAHMLVFTFPATVGSAGTASVTQGSAGPPTAVLGPDANQVTVNLTNVTNAQHLIVTLSNVHDTAGQVLASVAARMDVLAGDTNEDGAVNSGDISQTKSQSGQPVTTSNLREDLNTDGSINSGDISLVKSKSGTGYPL